jgi:hypothetical protein
MPSNAAKVLQELRMVRLRGQAPSHTVCVTTDAKFTELFEEMGLAVIEVWRRDVLDWSPLAGLEVLAVVCWSEQADRLGLLDAIRSGGPERLNWIALWRGEIVGRIYDHGRGRIRGTV